MAEKKQAGRRRSGGRVNWRCALQLDSTRRVQSGSATALSEAVRRGADLRIGTAFRHNEHIDVESASTELIEEVAEFRTTYLLEDRWTAGFMTLRVPISLPEGFGPRPSMSFFLYNQDGSQAIARPHLDGRPARREPGSSKTPLHHLMPKYHQSDNWDAGTNAPSHNFIYDFEEFRYWVRDDWKQVLGSSPEGHAVEGSVAALAASVWEGREVKVGIRGLCSDLADGGPPVKHEVFVHVGSCYYYTEQQLFIGGTHPVVRVKPSVPLRYGSRSWDFGWLMVRSDGLVQQWLVDPYTLRFRRSRARLAMRWFVR